MHGHPPSITVMPCWRPYSAAAGETLPAPGPRCIQTRLMPRSAHSRMVASAACGLVPINTQSTPPGTNVPEAVNAAAPQATEHDRRMGFTGRGTVVVPCLEFAGAGDRALLSPHASSSHEAEVAAMSKDQAIARMQQYWAKGSRGIGILNLLTLFRRARPHRSGQSGSRWRTG